MKPVFLFLLFSLITIVNSTARAEEEVTFRINFKGEDRAIINGAKKKFKNPKLIFKNPKLKSSSTVRIASNFGEELFTLVDETVDYLYHRRVWDVAFYCENSQGLQKPEFIRYVVPNSSDFGNKSEVTAVEVAFIVSRVGRVQGVEFLTSAPPEYSIAILEAMGDWRFLPVFVDGKAELSRVKITFEFGAGELPRIGALVMEHVGSNLVSLFSSDDKRVIFGGSCLYAQGPENTDSLKFSSGFLMMTESEMFVHTGGLGSPSGKRSYDFPISESLKIGLSKHWSQQNQVQLLQNDKLYVLQMIKGGTVDIGANKKLYELLKNRDFVEFSPEEYYDPENTRKYENSDNETEGFTLVGNIRKKDNFLKNEISCVFGVGNKIIKDPNQHWKEPVHIKGNHAIVQLCFFTQGSKYSFATFELNDVKWGKIGIRTHYIEKLDCVLFWLEDEKSGDVLVQPVVKPIEIIVPNTTMIFF